MHFSCEEIFKNKRFQCFRGKEESNVAQFRSNSSHRAPFSQHFPTYQTLRTCVLRRLRSGQDFTLPCARAFLRTLLSLVKMANKFQLLFSCPLCCWGTNGFLQLSLIKKEFASTFLSYTFVFQVCLIIRGLRKFQRPENWQRWHW